MSKHDQGKMTEPMPNRSLQAYMSYGLRAPMAARVRKHLGKHEKHIQITERPYNEYEAELRVPPRDDVSRYKKIKFCIVQIYQDSTIHHQ